MEAVMVDTGVWYSMFDPRDEHFKEGTQKAEFLESRQIIIPWPSMFEVLRTRFVKKTVALARFETFLKSPRRVFLDDAPFRQAAFDLALESSLRRNRPLSMIDCLIRLMIEDVNIRVHFLATFNLADFSDVCLKRKVQII